MMKNLVKKSKSKSWLLLPPTFIVSVFLTYSIFLWLYIMLANSLGVNLNDPQLIFREPYFLLYLVSLSGGVIGVIYTGEFIWKKVNLQVLSNKECRNAHHISLIKKYILLGDKERSEKLLYQYKNSNYKNDKILYFYCGAYDLKFFDLNIVNILNSIDFKNEKKV